MLDRRSPTPIEVISIPSTIILPAEGSVNRRKDSARVDFPDAVLGDQGVFQSPVKQHA